MLQTTQKIFESISKDFKSQHRTQNQFTAKMKVSNIFLLLDHPHNSAAGGKTSLTLYLMGEALSS